MKNSKIEWTDNTWNPWRGCKKVSAGCKNCYMYRDQNRYGNDPTMVVRAAPATFNSPLHWQEQGRVFTCSWSDFFIEQADAWRAEAWAIIRKTHHTYQVLTKRIRNVADRLPADWGSGYENVWLGTSVEDAANLYRAEELCSIPARTRFISYEPALGPVDFDAVLATGKIHWLISGGESGAGARNNDPMWFDSARLACQRHGVAFFHKQNGGNRKIDGAWGGRELSGTVYHEFPLERPIYG